MKGTNGKSKLPVAVASAVAVIAFAGGTITAFAVSERKNTLNIMAEMADKRVQLIDRFIEDAKKTLTIYADAPELKKMLNDTNNKTTAAEAQEFTERYSEHINDLEGIYASDLSTLVLAHNNSALIGVKTRAESDSASLMQSIIDSKDGIYNNGLILSPASGKHIVAMYTLIRDDDDNYIGFAGLGLMAESLFNNDIPSLKGIENASYTIINTTYNKYIFNNDFETGRKEVTNDSILSLCGKLSETEEPAKGTIEYRDKNDSYIAAYSFMPEYDILVMVEGTSKKLSVY